MSDKKQVLKVYGAFGVQGGTIHQLLEKILKCKPLVESICTDYLVGLMNTSDENYLNGQLTNIKKMTGGGYYGTSTK